MFVIRFIGAYYYSVHIHTSQIHSPQTAFKERKKINKTIRQVEPITTKKSLLPTSQKKSNQHYAQIEMWIFERVANLAY